MDEWNLLRARAGAPALLDMRHPDELESSEWMLAGAHRMAPGDVRANARRPGVPKRAVVFASDVADRMRLCVHLREQGVEARALVGPGTSLDEAVAARGHETSGHVLRLVRKRPDLGLGGGAPSRWVTRSGPKVDRVACTWLIRRFIDPDASISFAPAAQVKEVALAEGAVPFDVEGCAISHRWERCSFDALLEAFRLDDPALHAMAPVIRAADTSRLSIASQSAGLLAISLGLSQFHADDDMGMVAMASPLYDGLYVWCSAGQPMRHDWREHVADERG